ncbi:response regulator [Pseudoalteromonas sp. HM-SA03]|uniref:response regulator n=1 Tax=Pseudoalteromonas sp. HM-SA03 TaxID=2029678 RepID=UPI000BADDFDE|nr:response regulator [Pseudoalteromonas sp. HM-SA03]PAY00396.1 response regulator [Pseudoalteromonas sp. HM-SA03]
MKILLVDDSAATLEIIRRGLVRFRYRKLLIKKTQSAKEALKIIGSWHPDIVLTDWHMPDISGLALVKAIKQKQLDVTMAMVTTVDDREQIKLALDYGAAFVLSKPFADDDLHNKIMPLVKAAEESSKTREIHTLHKGVPLPQVGQLEKLMNKHIDTELRLYQVHQMEYDPDNLPCVMVAYEDPSSQKVRAIGIFDVYSVCVLAASTGSLTDQAGFEAIHQHQITDNMLTACHSALNSTSYAFLDGITRRSLRVKTLQLVTKPFPKLKRLYKSAANMRIDLCCQRPNMAQGKILLVGFLS